MVENNGVFLQKHAGGWRAPFDQHGDDSGYARSVVLTVFFHSTDGSFRADPALFPTNCKLVGGRPGTSIQFLPGRRKVHRDFGGRPASC